MRNFLTLLCLLITFNISAQDKKKGLFKSIYDELFKYSSIYVAGDMQNPKENPKDYFVRTNPSGNIYEPPVVVDGTDYYDFDYRYVDIHEEGITKADLEKTVGKPVHTVPQIFVDETHVGGFTEFEAYAKEHLGLYAA